MKTSKKVVGVVIPVKKEAKKRIIKTVEEDQLTAMVNPRKEKKPKIELVTYTVRATIPTGAYSNICPEVIVKAESLEVAERAVMPHIERLFAKYRDTNGQSKEIREEPAQLPGQATLPIPANKIETAYAPTAQEVSSPSVPMAQTVTPATTNTVTASVLEKAKTAIGTCTGMEAMHLLYKQITGSEKLTEIEKSILFPILFEKEIFLCSSMAELTETRKQIDSDTKLFVGTKSNLLSLCAKKEFELA